VDGEPLPAVEDQDEQASYGGGAAAPAPTAGSAPVSELKVIAAPASGVQKIAFINTDAPACPDCGAITFARLVLQVPELRSDDGAADLPFIQGPASRPAFSFFRRRAVERIGWHLVRPSDTPRVDHPLALGQHEGMPLLAAERPVPTELRLGS